MTFLQWIKKHKNDSDETLILANIILSDEEKPKRCKSVDKWVSYLKSKNAKDNVIKIFRLVWKRFTIQTKLNELGESLNKTDKFLSNFVGKKKDSILCFRIMNTFEVLKWEVDKEKEWLYVASDGMDQVFFRPSENKKGFIILSEYSSPELIPYGASCSEIGNRIAHTLEFNEAYRLKYHEEEIE